MNAPAHLAADRNRFGRRMDLAYRLVLLALVGLWLIFPPARIAEGTGEPAKAEGSLAQ